MSEEETGSGERADGRSDSSDVTGDRRPPKENLRDANEQLTLTALQAQEQSDESAARYRDLVDDVDAIVWEAKADADSDILRFTFVSQRAQAILGYPVERWLQEPTFWIDLIHPDDRVETVTAAKSIATGSKEVRIEYRALASEGRVMWLALIGRVRERDCGPVLLRGVMVDITESKRTEATLQQLVRELETSRADLQERNEELERFHDITVGRELKMMHAEKEVKRLQRELDALASRQSLGSPEGAPNIPPDKRVGAELNGTDWVSHEARSRPSAGSSGQTHVG